MCAHPQCAPAGESALGWPNPCSSGHYLQEEAVVIDRVQGPDLKRLHVCGSGCDWDYTTVLLAYAPKVSRLGLRFPRGGFGGGCSLAIFSRLLMDVAIFSADFAILS